MSTTLYRKYRPQKFSEVVDQNHIKVTLQNEIATGKLAHAYLFSGPRGIGKTTIARVLAKALNCKNLQGIASAAAGGIEPTSASSVEPCDECASCAEIREGRSLDLVEIDAASNRGIDDIRDLRDQTKYTPIKEKYKVFIIDEVHMLTDAAFNALLKTLEEPPAYAVFILATTEVHKIPETIISRCQRFDFKKVPVSAAMAHLAGIAAKENIQIEGKVLENIARSSEGYLRDAVSLLGQVLSLGETAITEEAASLVLPRSDWQKVMELIVLLLAGQTKEALLLVDQLFEEGVDLEHFTKITVETWRKILLCKMTGDWQDLAWEAGEDWLKKLTEASQRFSGPDLVKIIEIFMEALVGLKQALIVQLPVEIAIVKTAEVTAGQSGLRTLKNPPEKKEPPVSGGQSSGQSNGHEQSDGQSEVQAPSFTAPATALRIEHIQSKWPEVIEALRSLNHSVAAFLQVGRPVELKGETIVVGFQYNFHYDRVREAKYLAIIKDVLSRVFGQPLNLTGLIDEQFSENIFAAKPGEKKMVDQVLETFGGEVI
ncbi:MAG: DNA polymerase III subunit gamma/tau [Candidatus Komeilibacteria bacterium]|nr:DNA polymerase III subunit gamma/tau [Candidatus Komeilibacteria bacterium]